MSNPESFLDAVRNRKILVIGDVMLDQYLKGTADRISPEAPVPVLMHQSTEYMPGGAANVALNLKGLGAEVWLASVMGTDTMGGKLQALLHDAGIHTDTMVRVEERPTTCKTRVMSGNQHLLRVDREIKSSVAMEIMEMIAGRVQHLIKAHEIDLVIFQDYNKGLLHRDSISLLAGLLRDPKIPVAVDPKFENYFEYRDVTIFKPNLLELRHSVPFDVDIHKDSLDRAAGFLREKLQCDMIIITLSEHGIYGNSSSESVLLPAQKMLITDVCGAGDTVISVASLAYLAGLDLHSIAYWAGLCGTLVCQFPGVRPISAEMMHSDH